jgi:Protein of unknown function (DUF3224)
MKLLYAARMWTLAGLGLCAGRAAEHGVRAQPARQAQKEAAVAHHASGTFDVKLTPQQPEEALADSGIGRMLLDKQFHGDLEAASKGEMLAFGGPAKGSGGYVAIERVTGALGGRSGSFALQHSGTMKPGALQLSITVIPDSGTGELAGIAGSMNILIEGGKHSYTFDYTLPEGP